MNEIDLEKSIAVLAVFDDPDTPVGRAIFQVVKHLRALKQSNQELAAEISKLIKAVADHVTMRGEYLHRAEAAEHQLAEARKEIGRLRDALTHVAYDEDEKCTSCGHGRDQNHHCGGCFYKELLTPTILSTREDAG
jgi:DNA repair exonuclease SbcCD ATPase subunit